MGYHHVNTNDIEPFDSPGREFRSIGRAIGLETLGISHVVAEPGEQIPLQYHYHEEQEEAFYVISGVLHVETPDDEYVVEEDEVFIAEPTSPHRAYNPNQSASSVEVLAFGAPSVDDIHPYEP
ncbi:cupin 2 barrel domain protein [Natrialba magadii ATCC 43099]|uniref:Cupin n=1 Tax=Natrialba magadii (strain ATCC 43099 / DSM 3394 / CCM 3739 / CIP 104546 / IAM 13178 / JCM 8861 / NBRC 102185 / NCIMB 2190 / MS3) TaxID=547559 RepID=D3SUQ5_NATMM|nr:cupin domain-containing protein [Natrialba magadii]ADD05313.1 cupin 2 barrel domain protein [Natrialba magadii ATCC 43099]ELY29138.1 cupin [Natrialba magadii ATCC 43099]